MNDKTYLSLFYKMLLIRMVEDKIIELYPEQEMRCPVHLSIGQEAIAVGVCANLSREDIVLSNHRCHGHYLAKGGNLKAMIHEIYGKSTGCCLGRGGSMHLLDLSVNFLGSTPIVGGTIPIAVGTSFASKMQQKKNITTIFHGDGAVEEGVFHESLNFASLKKLPILFICENNLYSVYTPISERQPNREIYKLVEAHGIEAHQENGNDVLKVYNSVKKSVKKIRDKNEPIFFEFLTYRYREHCGPNIDDNLGYRPEEEVKKWRKQCPLHNFERYLLNNEIVKKSYIEKMKEKIKTEINEAFNSAKKAPFPKKVTINDYVYT